MTPRAKTILMVLIAMFLGGTGYFFIINQPKPQVIPPINTSTQTEEIDTSNWQTYRSETLGFEIPVPPKWAYREHIGFGSLEDNFWRQGLGEVSFIENGVKRQTKYEIKVIETDLQFEEVIRQVGISEGKKIIFKNLFGIKFINDTRGRGQNDYQEKFLIKDGKRYFYLEFNVSPADFTKSLEQWKTVLSLFSPIPQPQIKVITVDDTKNLNDWQVYNNDTLGLKFKYPTSWEKDGYFGPYSDRSDFWLGLMANLTFSKEFATMIIEVVNTKLSFEDISLKITSPSVILENIELNGWSSKKYSTVYQNAHEEVYLVKVDDRFYRITLSAYTRDREENIRLLNSVLETFIVVSP